MATRWTITRIICGLAQPVSLRHGVSTRFLHSSRRLISKLVILERRSSGAHAAKIFDGGICSVVRDFTGFQNWPRGGVRLVAATFPVVPTAQCKTQGSA